MHRYWIVDDLRIIREASGSGISSIKRFIKEVDEYAGKN